MDATVAAVLRLRLITTTIAPKAINKAMAMTINIHGVVAGLKISIRGICRVKVCSL